MKCRNCGADFENGASKCPFCGTSADWDISFEKNDNIVDTATQTMNPLLNKEYHFSGNDLAVKGRWGVSVNVTVGEDRLYIETIPAKKNVLPAIILEDIMAIKDEFHLRTANVVIGIIGLILGLLSTPWGFVFPVFVLLFYRERKIVMHLRNGNVLTIYSNDKVIVEQFIEDMKKITKIK